MTNEQDPMPTNQPELVAGPFCGAHLTVPTPVQYPKMGLARIHPGDVDDGSCPIAWWGFYDHQVTAWNTRPEPAALDQLDAKGWQGIAEGGGQCQACKGSGGVREDQGDGAYVGAECPICRGHGFSEDIEDAVWSAIMEAQGPDSNARDYARAALLEIARLRAMTAPSEGVS